MQPTPYWVFFPQSSEIFHQEALTCPLEHWKETKPSYRNHSCNSCFPTITIKKFYIGRLKESCLTFLFYLWMCFSLEFLNWTYIKKLNQNSRKSKLLHCLCTQIAKLILKHLMFPINWKWGLQEKLTNSKIWTICGNFFTLYKIAF